MSLIQDALKRRLEDAEKTPGPEAPAMTATPATPATPAAPGDAPGERRRIGLSRNSDMAESISDDAPPNAPAAEASAPTAPTAPTAATAATAATGKQSSASHAWALGVALLLLLVLVGSLAVGAYYAYERWFGAPVEFTEDDHRGETPRTTDDFVPVAPAETEMAFDHAGGATVAHVEDGAPEPAGTNETSVNIPAVVTPPAPSVQETVDAMAANAGAPGIADRVRSAAQLAQDRAAPEETAVKEDNGAAHPTASAQTNLPAAKETTGATEWPFITVGGFLGGGTHGSVILNGEMRAIGETIQGVEILAIEQRGVVLRYAGQTKLFKMGQSTQ